MTLVTVVALVPAEELSVDTHSPGWSVATRSAPCSKAPVWSLRHHFDYDPRSSASSHDRSVEAGLALSDAAVDGQ